MLQSLLFMLLWVVHPSCWWPYPTDFGQGGGQTSLDTNKQKEDRDRLAHVFGTLGDYDNFSHLATGSWLNHLWHFCHESKIQLEPSTKPIPLACEDDVFLMLQF
jgi:hypothetical protein